MREGITKPANPVPKVVVIKKDTQVTAGAVAKRG